MDNKWVKLSLTLIKSCHLLLLSFYSLSYLLPICLHWPFLRSGAPLIPSQNWDSLAHSSPLSIPFKNLRSKASPPANHSWTCPNSIQRSSSSLPFLTEKQPNAPIFTYSGCFLLLRRRALTINFHFQQVFPQPECFPLEQRPSISPSPVFKLTFTSFSTALPIAQVDALYHTNTNSCPKTQSCHYSAVGIPNQSETLLTGTEQSL